jgi:hypothetical protein
MAIARHALLILLTLFIAPVAHAAPKFTIVYPAAARSVPATGRLFLFLSRTNEPEVRLQDYWIYCPQFLGVDVNAWKPDQVTEIDEQVSGYPFHSLKDLPPGDYYVQAYLQVYVSYPRADGHTVWAPDQWEGHRHRLGQTPGDLFSPVEKVHVDADSTRTIALHLMQMVGPAGPPADTEWVKHIKIKSEILSRFWGRPIFLGANVLLPRGYNSHREVSYPIIYQQQIVMTYDQGRPPFDFSPQLVKETDQERRAREDAGYETGFDFYHSWVADHFPRMIAVRLLHPTPYGETSAMMNSANNGPFREAIQKELIPYIEEHFRVLREPYARMLVGKNVGARDAFALQLHYPDFFGGSWMFYPWPADFRRYFAGINLYEDLSAYELNDADVPEGYRAQWWHSPDRIVGRIRDGQPFVTMRNMGTHDAITADRWPGGEAGYDDAAFGPVGSDGYPKPLWNRLTGTIDHSVAEFWEQRDLSKYVRENWSKIGPQLSGKLHFYIGDTDDYLRNYSVYLLEDFLSTAKPAYGGSFEYGHRKGKDWQPMTNADLLQRIADTIKEGAPRGAPDAWRKD